MRTPRSKMIRIPVSAVIATLAGTPAMAIAIDTSLAQEWTTGLPAYLLFGSIALLVLGAMLKLFGAPGNAAADRLGESSHPIPGSIGVYRNSVFDHTARSTRS